MCRSYYQRTLTGRRAAPSAVSETPAARCAPHLKLTRPGHGRGEGLTEARCRDRVLCASTTICHIFAPPDSSIIEAAPRAIGIIRSVVTRPICVYASAQRHNEALVKSPPDITLAQSWPHPGPTLRKCAPPWPHPGPTLRKCAPPSHCIHAGGRARAAAPHAGPCARAARRGGPARTHERARGREDDELRERLAQVDLALVAPARKVCLRARALASRTGTAAMPAPCTMAMSLAD